jgi:1,4-dihydroxy-2-naphthoate octaprenyltransferase
MREMPRPISVWLLAMRLPSLTAAIVPVLVGTAAAADEEFHAWLFVLALLGSMALQAGTNLINDYYDHQLGTDTESSLGPSGVIQRGLLSPTAVLAGGVVAMGVGAAVGFILVLAAGWPVLVLGFASVFVGYAYTAPPLKLAYRGLGELTSFLFMGPVIVMGAAYVQTEHFTWQALLVSLPVGFLVASILHANNIRDIENDRRNNKRTLASLLGRPGADYEMLALIAAAFLTLVTLVATSVAPMTGLIALLALVPAYGVVQALARAKQSRELNIVLLRSVGLHLIFGLLWSLGIAIEAWR